jgi:hypothetical protein
MTIKYDDQQKRKSSVVILSVVILANNAEYRYAECHGTPNRYSVKSKV